MKKKNHKLNLNKMCNINGVDFIEYKEADLRFTGWEDECVILDRSKNHYLIPVTRYYELKELKESRSSKSKPLPKDPNEGASGMVGITGTVGTPTKK